MEKYLSIGWARTFDLQITNKILAGIFSRICSYWPGFFGHICSYWPWDFPDVSEVTCRDFPALTFPARRNVKILPSETRRPGFSSHICYFRPGLSGRRFSSIGDLKKTLWVAGNLFWYRQQDFWSLIREFSDGKLEQKVFFHSALAFKNQVSVAFLYRCVVVPVFILIYFWAKNHSKVRLNRN